MAQGFISNAGTVVQPVLYAFQNKDADFTAAVNTIYQCEHATPATLLNATLPATAADGDEVIFVTGVNTGLVKVKVNATDLKPMRINGSVSLSTSSGYWQSVGLSAKLHLRYFATDAAWVCIGIVGEWVNSAAVTQHSADSLQPLPIGAPTASGHAARLTDIGGAALTSLWVPGVSGPRSAFLVLAGGNGPAAAGIGASADGTVIVVAEGNITTALWNIFISTDSGASWAKTSAVPATTPPTTIAQTGITVFVTDANTFAVTYTPSAGGLLGYAKTTDGGATWTTNTKAVTSLTTGTVTWVHININTAIAVYAVSTTSAGYAYTSDAGATWTNGTVATETVPGGVNTFAVAALDTTTIYAFWTVGSGNKLRWSKTTNSGSTWAAAADLATDSFNSGWISALETTANNVVVTYRTNATVIATKLVRTTDGSTWSSPINSGSTGNPSQLGTTNFTALGYDGTTLAVMFYFAGTADVAFMNLWTSTDAGATWARAFSHGGPPMLSQTSAQIVPTIRCGKLLVQGGKMLSVSSAAGSNPELYLQDTRKMVMPA